MKRISIIIGIAAALMIYSTAFAVQVQLTLESNSPATLPTVTRTIDIPDPNDQLEVSRQATLLALSPDGWNLESYGAYTVLLEPPDWTGSFYYLRVPAQVQSLFGYYVDLSTLSPGAGYLLYFHTDDMAVRDPHNICETANNNGVISGGSDGNYTQCFVASWGSFHVEAGPQPVVGTLLDLDPDVIEIDVKANKKPKEPVGAYLTAYIEPPAGVQASDISTSTLILSMNGTQLATANSTVITGNLLKVSFKLSLANMGQILGVGALQVDVSQKDNQIVVTTAAAPAQLPDLIELIVSGSLTDGRPFSTGDAVRVEVLKK